MPLQLETFVHNLCHYFLRSFLRRISQKIELLILLNKTQLTSDELLSNNRRGQFNLEGASLEIFYGRKNFSPNRSETGSPDWQPILTTQLQRLRFPFAHNRFKQRTSTT